jgi:hypothetical protein
MFDTNRLSGKTTAGGPAATRTTCVDQTAATRGKQDDDPDGGLSFSAAFRFFDARVVSTR